MPEWFKGAVCNTVIRWFKSNCGLKIYGVCSSEEEHLVVVQDVVGSIPISHPKWFFSSMDRTCGYGPQNEGSSPSGTTLYRSVVKGYHHSLQNCYWRFESVLACKRIFGIVKLFP